MANVLSSCSIRFLRCTAGGSGAWVRWVAKAESDGVISSRVLEQGTVPHLSIATESSAHPLRGESSFAHGERCGRVFPAGSEGSVVHRSY